MIQPTSAAGPDRPRQRGSEAPSSPAASTNDLLETASPERARAIMEERGLLLAKVPLLPPAAGEVLEIVTFLLSRERYGIESIYVREVTHLQDLAPVPETPEFLAGVTNLRGEVLAIMDLRKFFGLAADQATNSMRVIVLGTERPEFGILVDEVQEASLLRTDELLAPADSFSGIGHEHIQGVTKEALIVLKGAALLSEGRFVIDQTEESQ
jgi:purine-binding chemotaxis protein CheW